MQSILFKGVNPGVFSLQRIDWYERSWWKGTPLLAIVYRDVGVCKTCRSMQIWQIIHFHSWVGVCKTCRSLPRWEGTHFHSHNNEIWNMIQLTFYAHFWHCILTSYYTLCNNNWQVYEIYCAHSYSVWVEFNNIYFMKCCNLLEL